MIILESKWIVPLSVLFNNILLLLYVYSTVFFLSLNFSMHQLSVFFYQTNLYYLKDPTILSKETFSYQLLKTQQRIQLDSPYYYLL